MPAPCCLLWAGALPRPPEVQINQGYHRFHKCPAIVAAFLGLLVLLVTVTSVNSTVTSWGDNKNCPIRRDALDAASRAIVSPQVVEAVFEGDMPSSYLSASHFAAPFRITKVHKRYRGPRRLKKRRTVTLTFKQPFVNSQTDKSCLVSANLTPKKKYFLFVSGASSKRDTLRPVSAPLPFTKKARRRIRHATCSGCAKAPSVGRLRDDSVVRGHDGNLSCTFDGTPTPVVTWYKDGQLLKHPLKGNIRIYTRRVRIRPRIRRMRRRRMLQRRTSQTKNLEGRGDAIQKRRKSRSGPSVHPTRFSRLPFFLRKKKRKKSRGALKEKRPPRTVRVFSTLAITASEEQDAGLYSCRGRSVVGEASAKAHLTIVPPLDPGIVYPCPYDSYCLNGGTCMFFKLFGEFVCQCAEGYKGQRCQEKEVFPTLGGQNCRGPMPYGHSSPKGVRCPRNQPLALWELLQQSLQMNIRKPSPWNSRSKSHWPSSHTPDSFWSPSRGKFIWHPLLLIHRDKTTSRYLPSRISFLPDSNHNETSYSNFLIRPKVYWPNTPSAAVSNQNRSNSFANSIEKSSINGSLSFPREFYSYTLARTDQISSVPPVERVTTNDSSFRLNLSERRTRHKHGGKRRRSKRNRKRKALAMTASVPLTTTSFPD